jgi:hypothetical protein
MIWFFWCLMLVVACSFYVFCLPGRRFVVPATMRSGYLRERKEAAYENLRDLNFEYTAGKIPDADYASLKSSLQDEAATLLAEITRLEKRPSTAIRRHAEVRKEQQ